MSPASLDEKRVCSEEKKAQSGIPSPGPVANHEHLARIVLSPLHLANGKLDTKFLNLGDLERGWSFLRREYADEGKIQAHGKRKADRKSDQKMYGYAVINAAEFRAIRDLEGRQAFCILDDERKDAPAHAIAKKSAPREKSELRDLREQVLELLEQKLIAL